MKEIIEKMNSKKEYAAPQMEIMALDVQGAMLSCSDDPADCPIDVEVD